MMKHLGGTILFWLLFISNLFSSGANYLIIAHDNFYDAVKPLAIWKQKRGLITKTVKLSEIGYDTASIKSYIRNAYSNWNPRPQYVLLVGDRNFIPLGMYFPNWILYYPWRGTWTDQYYVNLTEQTDYRDDMYLGRLPCSTPTECSIMVNKIIYYEQGRGLSKGNWFIKATGIARDRRENNQCFDSCYLTAIREIRKNLSDYGFIHIDTLFTSNNADYNVVEESITQGRNFVVYRGSTLSSTDNWNNPFGVRPERIRNDSMPAIVISPTCRTMFFPENLPSYPEPQTSAGNKWIKQGTVSVPRGAVAFFGTTTHYHAGFDTFQTYWRNAAAIKFFETITKESVFVLGEVIRKVKDSVLACCSLLTIDRLNHPIACSVAYMEWNLLGDPSLNLWRSPPQLMSVVHETIIDVSPQTFTVSVRDSFNYLPISNALVTLLKDSVIYQYQYTNDFGVAEFSIHPQTYGIMSVTITKRGYQVYEKNVLTCFENDVGVIDIIQPRGIIDSMINVVVPKAKIKNFGLYPATFNIQFKINNWVSSRLIESLPSQEEIFVTFDPWIIGPRGNYVGKCICQLTDDLVPQNDTLETHFTVVPHIVGWIQKEVLPTQVPNQYVRYGGALVGTDNYIFAFRGNKSNEFYKYSIEEDKWSLAESIPFGRKPNDPLQINRKQVGNGAALCFDGINTIYATKGAGTRELWAYNITNNSWTQKAFVPSIIKRGLRGGTSIVFENNKLYLLAGEQNRRVSTNFLCYFPSADTLNGEPWQLLNPAPLEPDYRTYRNGSCLVALGDEIYALKGWGKHNYFYAYDTKTGTWTVKETIPQSHPQLLQKNKVKNGASMTTDGQVIYAIKGLGKNEFWQYQPSLIKSKTDLGDNQGIWLPLDTIPRLHKKSVPKYGASLTYAQGKIYLLKGNNTPEFWQYTPITEISNINCQQNLLLPHQETISHNNSLPVINPILFIKNSTIFFNVLRASKVVIKLYNSCGRCIEVINNDFLEVGTYQYRLDFSLLPKGIYFLKYEDITSKGTLKIFKG
ncbi:MAG: C25 family cysteine peptidase [candidate division WOR-3 bacterium]|nr:C25 family cysteine peptidase [candidate division WOR-3 bacterium]